MSGNYSRSRMLIFIVLLAVSTRVFAGSPKMVKQWGSPGMVMAMSQSRDGSFFATMHAGDYSRVFIWNSTGRLHKVIDHGTNLMTTGDVMSFSPDNRRIALVSNSEIGIYELGRDTVEKFDSQSSNYNSRSFYAAAFIDNNTLAVASSLRIVNIVPLTIDQDTFENEVLPLLTNPVDRAVMLDAYQFDEERTRYTLRDGIGDSGQTHITTLMVTGLKGVLEQQYSYETRNVVETWTAGGQFLDTKSVLNYKQTDVMARVAVSPDAARIAAATMNGDIQIIDLVTGTVSPVKGDLMINGFSFDRKSTLVGWSSSAGFRVCNMNGLFVINQSRTIGVCTIDLDQQVLIESTVTSNEQGILQPVIKEWSLQNELIHTWEAGDTMGMKVLLSKDKKRILAGTQDGSITMINRETGGRAAVVFEGGDWLVYTPDGLWDSSRNGGRLVSMVEGLTVYGIDQFAFKNNRPDLILQRLGFDDDTLISHYNKLYQKRLRRMGIDESMIKGDLHIPVVSLKKKQQDGKFIDLQFVLSDEKYGLMRYNIYVNDVPVLGAAGKSVSGSTATVSERVELTSGDNKIEISCFNRQGAESFRQLIKASYNKRVKPDLYYIGFGVSDYRDPEISDLTYAHQDVLDLADMLGATNPRFGKTYIHTFVNSQVTVKSITTAKKLLKNARVDDVFILFIAGHGVHDNNEEATYYYLTSDTKLSSLSKTAADFELVEDLLHGIAPRRKLFLMDTCESGEVDEEDRVNYFFMADSRGLKARAIRGLDVSSKKARKVIRKKARRYLFEADRFIYNDLVRRSGAIVFSSSKGGEFSYESAAYQNGLFTETIIRALSGNDADADSDGMVSIDELRDFVIREVPRMTENSQHPTVDRDNIYQKFGLPVVREQ
jgi:WD40 repeat protein